MRLYGKPCADLQLRGLPRFVGAYLTAPDLFDPFLDSLDPSREYRRLAKADGGSKWIVTSKYPHRMRAWWMNVAKEEGYLAWVAAVKAAGNLGTCIEIRSQDDVDQVAALSREDFPSRWNMVLFTGTDPVDLSPLEGWVDWIQFGTPMGSARLKPMPLDTVRQAIKLGFTVELFWSGWVPEEYLGDPLDKCGNRAVYCHTGKKQSYFVRDGFVRVGSFPAPRVVDGMPLMPTWIGEPEKMDDLGSTNEME